MKADVRADAVKRNERIVELLAKTGVDAKLARIAVFLSTVPEAVSRAIEREANLRQPEVSLGMKELRELGWVDEKTLKRKGEAFQGLQAWEAPEGDCGGGRGEEEGGA